MIHCYYSIVVAVEEVDDCSDFIAFPAMMTISISRQFRPVQIQVAYCFSSINIAVLSPSLQSSSSAMLVPSRFGNLFSQLSQLDLDVGFASIALVRVLQNLVYLILMTLAFEFLRL